MSESDTVQVARIIKLGGSAITDKNSLETLNSAVLKETARQLKKVYDTNKQDGMVLVHGAGSFGHFQASASGVAKGGIERESVKKGFVETRLSVTKLNHLVVEALVEEGLPAVGVSPCGHWITNNRKMAQGQMNGIFNLIKSGLIPVMHGDAVVDQALGCTILSGDVIIKHVAETVSPRSVIFLTNVPGVFDRPPNIEGATMVKKIHVMKDGSWSAVGLEQGVTLTSSAHDTTGGIATKVKEAADIVCMGIDVMIVQAATQHSLNACLNGINVQSNWIGTHLTLLDTPAGSK